MTGHIHEREAGYHLSRLLEGESSASTTIKVAFIPSVAPWFSGIISTVSIPLSTVSSMGGLWVGSRRVLKVIEWSLWYVILNFHGWDDGESSMTREMNKKVLKIVKRVKRTNPYSLLVAEPES